MVSEHIDDLVEFKYKAVNSLKNEQHIIALLSDNPDIDLETDDTSEWEDRILDYDYVDDTTVQDGAYITVECEMAKLNTSTMKTMAVYCHVICAKGYMSMKKFKGMKGNRRDNLVRWCVSVLADNMGYGVGALLLKDVVITTVPDGFTSTLCTFEVPSFR